MLLLVLALPGCLEGGGGLFGRANPVDPYDYLTDGDYSEWHIEVDHVAGWAPRPSALSLLDQRMTELATKDRITVAVDTQSLPSRPSWTADDLLALQGEHQDRRTGGKTVVTYVAYVDGKFAEDAPDQRTLGLTIGHDLVVIFIEQVESACEPGVYNPENGVPSDPQDVLPCLGGEERIEQAVLVHEFGHAIGLVNRGIPMVTDHEDDENPRHSGNPESVMYWAVESAGTLMEFNSQIPLTFDADDKRDVCDAGGRC